MPKGIGRSINAVLEHQYGIALACFKVDDGREIIQTVQPILSTGSNEALKSAIQAGLGIVYSLRPVFGNLAARGEVQEILKN